MILHGDMRERLREFDADSIDAVVTDPPYDLTSGGKVGFMGALWDGTGVAFDPATWCEVLRVAKPGAHLLAFGGTRTHHRMMAAIEDAGWELRDVLMWVFATGFPKSLNVGEGRGTAIKPAYEAIVLARKPLIGTVARNLARYGTGALNIDACRVPYVSNTDKASATPQGQVTSRKQGLLGMPKAGSAENRVPYDWQQGNGRFPANLLHDGSEEVLAGFPYSKSNPNTRNNSAKPFSHKTRAKGADAVHSTKGYADEGSAARFFYCTKASAKDRGEGNIHFTVKPTELMRYLVRLITPPGGIVLDPFAGSGSTGKAARLEGRSFVGIEQDATFCEIARRRIVV